MAVPGVGVWPRANKAKQGRVDTGSFLLTPQPGALSVCQQLLATTDTQLKEPRHTAQRAQVDLDPGDKGIKRCLKYIYMEEVNHSGLCDSTTLRLHDSATQQLAHVDSSMSMF